MQSYLLFLVLVLLFIMPIKSEADANDLIITISTAGKAEVTHNLQPKSYFASITVQTISDKISNILATDERGFILDTSQQDDSIQITTLGATSVRLSYNAEIVSNDSGVWQVSYNSNDESTLILPSLAKIISLKNIPTYIKDDTIVIPGGQILIRYAISEVSTKDFVISSEGIQHMVHIMTVSEVDVFRYDSGSILFSVNDNVPVLVMIPNSLFSKPVEILLNDQLIEHRNYYQNGTYSWIRIEPPEIGSITITEKMPEKTQGGGCLIATATYGSELAPQVQQLRELRDNSLLETESGLVFMESFNQFYYSFSPTIADLERENPVFKEIVKLTITPLLSSLSLLNYVNMDSEYEVLGYGIGIIMMNIGMYFIAPAIAIIHLKRHFINI